MAAMHIGSTPFIELTEQMNALSARLEVTQRLMDQLAISASILRSEENTHLAIVSDLVQLQLKCIARFEQSKNKNLEDFKSFCESQVEMMGQLFWKRLSQITAGEAGNREEFIRKWRERSIEHVLLPKLKNVEEIPEYKRVLQQKLSSLPKKEELHVKLLSEEAAIKKKYDELAELKASLAAAVRVNNVFEAAQAGDLAYLEKAKPKPLFGFGKEKKVNEFVNQKDKREYSLLHIAAYAGRLEVVRFLLENGADPKVSDEEGDTPLHWAAAIGAHEVAQLLLEFAVDPNVRGKNGGWVPLHRAVYNGHQDVTRLLLDFGADVNMRTEDQYHYPPIREAIRRNDFQMVRYLMRFSPVTVDQDDLDEAEAGRHPGIIDMVRNRMGLKSEGVEEIPRISITELEIEKPPIGSGSFAEVFRANWNGRVVAAKILKSKEDPESDTGKYIREEVEGEGRVMYQLDDNDHVLKFHGMLEGKFGFVVDFISNGDLYEKIPNIVKTTWDWNQILTFGKQMAQGMAYLHSKQILHRDFKSLNVLVNDQNQPVIADFGLSKIRKYEMTLSEGVGSPAWMAPEQFTSREYSYPIDVYALGMVLWEIIEAKRPFADLQDVFQVMHRITMQQPGETIDPTIVPKPLADLLQSCWSDPLHRPKADHVASTLREVLELHEDALEGYQRPFPL